MVAPNYASSFKTRRLFPADFASKLGFFLIYFAGFQDTSRELVHW